MPTLQKQLAVSDAMDHPLAVALAGALRRGPVSPSPIPKEIIAEQCSIASDNFDYTMQVFLFVVCMGSLLLKWHLEVPQRKLFIFFMDVSKQMVGAGILHLINMVQAIILEARGVGDTDPCGWYWITFLVDCTIGLVITLMYLKISEKVFGYKTGLYGDSQDSTVDWAANPDYSKWLGQMLVWTGITCLAKCTVMALIFCRLLFWGDLGALGTTWIGSTQWRLLYVMVVTPGIMDTVYFWITDEFIKYTKPPSDEKARDEAAGWAAAIKLDSKPFVASSSSRLGPDTGDAP